MSELQLVVGKRSQFLVPASKKKSFRTMFHSLRRGHVPLTLSSCVGQHSTVSTTEPSESPHSASQSPVECSHQLGTRSSKIKKREGVAFEGVDPMSPPQHRLTVSRLAGSRSPLPLSPMESKPLSPEPQKAKKIGPHVTFDSKVSEQQPRTSSQFAQAVTSSANAKRKSGESCLELVLVDRLASRSDIVGDRDDPLQHVDVAFAEVLPEVEGNERKALERVVGTAGIEAIKSRIEKGKRLPKEVVEALKKEKTKNGALGNEVPDFIERAREEAHRAVSLGVGGLSLGSPTYSYDGMFTRGEMDQLCGIFSEAMNRRRKKKMQ